MNRIRISYVLLSILTLILGISIYLLLRDLNNILLFSLLQKPDLNDKILVPLKPLMFSNILRYNIPDMLWFISAIFFLRFFWFYQIKVQTVYIMFFYLFGFVFETSQLLKNIPGTFDRLDLLFMGIGAFVEGLLYKKLILRRFL